MMKTPISRLAVQRLTALLMSGLALAVLIGTWLTKPAPALDALELPLSLLALGLAAGVAIAGQYAIHVRYHTKVTLTTPPLYLAAVLLPPPLAALTAGLGTLSSQLLARAKRGNATSTVATTVGRWVVVAFLSATVAHLPTDNKFQEALVLLGTASVMFVGDLVTSAFEIAPMMSERPLRVMRILLREGGPMEGVQYLLGILSAAAAFQQLWTLILLIFPAAVVYKAFKQTKEMQDSTRNLLESMADAVDLRDPYTGGHSRRVTELAMGILQELNIKGPEAALIRSAARVHDIGKIGVPDAILNKPGKLTPEEKRIMDSHPERGAELLARYPDFARGVSIVRHHHERSDGGGYPHGLKELDIPFGARVIAVADSFDAMTSDRPYRKAMSVAQAMQILRADRGRQWDLEIVEAFLRCLANAQAEHVEALVALSPAGQPVALASP